MIEQLFKETLISNNLFCTPERLRIFQELKNQKEPCSIAELTQVTADSIDPSTVYRNLEIFENIGVVVRVYSGWKFKYELSDRFSSHHHHMTCTNCGAVISFEESESFSQELSKLEHHHGFRSESHSLELKGLCRNCC